MARKAYAPADTASHQEIPQKNMRDLDSERSLVQNYGLGANSSRTR
jgi:hypothetical protein